MRRELEKEGGGREEGYERDEADERGVGFVRRTCLGWALALRVAVL